jgi:hypothetical protein
MLPGNQLCCQAKKRGCGVILLHLLLFDCPLSSPFNLRRSVVQQSVVQQSVVQ